LINNAQLESVNCMYKYMYSEILKFFSRTNLTALFDGLF